MAKLRLPLEGVRIASIEVVYAGPFATQILANMGAEVIMVESINYRPVASRPGKVPESSLENPGRLRGLHNKDYTVDGIWNRDASFNSKHFNKLSCTMNLTRPEGKDVFRRLVEKCDVFFENNSGAAIERLGLTYDVLSSWNDKLVYVNAPALATEGPYKDFIGYGTNMEALIGHAWLRGYPDEDPMHLYFDVYQMDASGGMAAAASILMGLWQRARTGKGQRIDSGSAQTVIPQFAEAIMEYTMNNRVRRTLGNRDLWAAPCGVYPCRGSEDRWICITCYNEEQWQGFCRAIGNPEWVRQEIFSTHASRYEHQDELDEHIKGWTSLHDDYEAMFILQKEGVPSAPVLNERDTLRDPQVVYRQFYERVDCTQNGTGVHMFPGMMWKYPKTPISIRIPPCSLGEHNEYVFKDIIGMTDEEITRLEKAEIIGGNAYKENVL
jgi:crotonobetainyl-CoA:carnitine CoA-transferase CaiB-like acyl-CoA transferase